MRKIAVLTGTRADYGRIRFVLEQLKKSHNLNCKLIVTGAHLSRRFGYTIKEILKDGFKVDYKIKMFPENFKDGNMAESLGLAVIGITKALRYIQPDIFLISVDRVETLAGAVAGAFLNIPVAHIGGGYVTGSIDESIRHAVSKLAHIHFAATEDSKQRLMRLGENPKYIFVVGAPDLDAIRQRRFAKPPEVKKQLCLGSSGPILIAVQHPVTTQQKDAGRQMKLTMEALNVFKFQTVLVYPNPDQGRESMLEVIKGYEKFSWLKAYVNIPYGLFLGLMNVSDAVIGNSSCGLIEAASFGLPAVNIGIRQQGRLRGANVIDVPHNKNKIIAAIKKALQDRGFQIEAKKSKNPYGCGAAAKKIAHILEKIDLKHLNLQKRLPF